MNNTSFPRLLKSAVLLLLGTTPVLAQPCDAVASTVATEYASLFAGAGTEDARLDLFYLTGTPLATPIDGSLTATDPTSVFRYQTASAIPPECQVVDANTPYPYDAYPIVPDASGTVRIRQDPSDVNRDAISITVFRATFDSQASSCPSFMGSTFQALANVPSVTIEVEAGSTYVVVVMTGQDPALAYPRPYRIFVEDASNDSAALPPTFYTPEPFAPGYAYTYLAIDETDTVRAASPVSDFRALPVGAYTFRGVNYDASALNANDFVGQGVDELPGDDPGNPNCLRLSGGTPLAITFVDENGPAPVDWLSFRAEAGQADVNLIWEVASETENDYFRVERSPDAARWTDIGEMAGNGTTQEYARFTYTDADPLAGTNYYRLAQVDFDGTEHRSTVVRVDWQVSSDLLIFPNPFTDQLTVRAPHVVPATDRPRLFDVQGRDVTDQLEMQVSETEARFATSNLATGVYMLRWAEREVRVVRQ